MNTPERRLTVLMWLRLVSLMWALVGIALTFTVMLFRTGFWVGLEFWPYGMPLVLCGFGFLTPAGGLAYFSQRLANWIVPLGACPQCGYAITPETTRCSECGTDFNRLK